MPKRYSSLQSRILANVCLQSGPLATDCWIWQGHKHRVTGYGSINLYIAGRTVNRLAHRISIMVFRGLLLPTPKRRKAKSLGLHLCNVRACVNPWHLKSGTNTDNQRQAVREGRNNPWAGVAARKMRQRADRGPGKLVLPDKEQQDG